MQKAAIEKKRGKLKGKTNHDKKKKYRSKGNNKTDEEAKIDDVRINVPKKSKKTLEDERKVFISAADPFDAPLKWWETEHVRYAINYPPVRFRLEKVIGSHVVRLTDRKYMLLLMTKLYENHVEQQKIRIEERKLSPPSIIRRLLELSYKALTQKLKEPRHNKLKLYV